MTIERIKGSFVVKSKSGKTLGKHKTRGAAVKQLGAVEASKARRKKASK